MFMMEHDKKEFKHYYIEDKLQFVNLVKRLVFDLMEIGFIHI